MKRHKGCGGIVKNRKCETCGRTWSRRGTLVGRGIEGVEPEKPKGFDPQEYKQRIRRGDDIKPYKREKKD